MKFQASVWAASALLSGAAATFLPAKAGINGRELEYVIKPKIVIVSML